MKPQTLAAVCEPALMLFWPLPHRAGCPYKKKLTYSENLPQDAHSSRWYAQYALTRNKKTHGNTMLRLPYALLRVCLRVKLQWQWTDRRQGRSVYACTQATTHTHTHRLFTPHTSKWISLLHNRVQWRHREAWPGCRANTLHAGQCQGPLPVVWQQRTLHFFHSPISLTC